jgi:hypothetical protein
MESTNIEAGPRASDLPATLASWSRRGIWLLPAWALLLTLSTLTHQPDYKTDFEAYAEYVTTTPFLVSHLVASIGGAALGCLGAVALGVHLATTPAARQALLGMAAFVVSQVLTPSVFGLAAFFQPAVGRTYLAGQRSVAQSINSDVYGPDVFAMVGVSLFLMIIGAVLLGSAAVRAKLGPRWSGVLFAIAVPVFTIGGQLFSFLHPIAGVAITISGIVLAARASRKVRAGAAPTTPPRP